MWSHERITRLVVVIGGVFVATEMVLIFWDRRKGGVKLKGELEEEEQQQQEEEGEGDEEVGGVRHENEIDIDINIHTDIHLDTPYINTRNGENRTSSRPIPKLKRNPSLRPAHSIFPSKFSLLQHPPKPPSKYASELYNLLYQISSDNLKRKTSIHFRFICSTCNEIGHITGSLYKCSECPGTFCCENCEKDGHDKAHSMYKINTPVSNTLINSITLSGKQISWIPESNIHYLKKNPFQLYPGYADIEKVKELVNNKMSDTEIGGLYDQFQCLVDCDVNNNKSLFKTFGAISKEGLEQLLITRYSSNRFLTDLILSIYDNDCDEVTSFLDFILGTNLIIHSSIEDKVIYLLAEIGKRVILSGLTYKEVFRNLFLSYIDLSKRTFSDALTIQSLKTDLEIREKDQLAQQSTTTPVYLPGSSNISYNSFDKEQDRLLWQNEPDIDSWGLYNPISDAPEMEAEISILWDMSIESLLDELIDDTDFDITILKHRILNTPKLCGAIQAFFEVGII